MKRIKPALCAVAVAAFGLGAVSARAQNLDNAMDREVGTEKAAASSQKKINTIADQTDVLVVDYRNTLDQTESLRRYNRQLEKLITSQETELESIRQQIEDVTVVGRDIKPLMEEMIETLDQIVDADVPFLRAERKRRVEFLKSLMTRSDVTDAERYRRILEAYQIEADYGRAIEAYSGPLTLDGEELQVDFLSIGRIALLYQTKDAERSGVWDHANQTWVDITGDYGSSVRQAFRIARKQAAPDLLTLPIAAPTGGE